MGRDTQCHDARRFPAINSQRPRAWRLDALQRTAWARGQSVHGGHSGGHGLGKTLIPAGFDEVSGEVINLTIGNGHRVVKGRRRAWCGIQRQRARAMDPA